MKLEAKERLQAVPAKPKTDVEKKMLALAKQMVKERPELVERLRNV